MLALNSSYQEKYLKSTENKSFAAKNLDGSRDEELGINAKEICSNGIGDDGDGFIDFADDDCKCYFSTAPTLNGLSKN